MSDLTDLFSSLSVQEKEVVPEIVRQQPNFPLPKIPRCRECEYTPTGRNYVTMKNPNGNAGRPYYICIRCKADRKPEVSQFEIGWITWDDDLGIHEKNPYCDCALLSRQDRAGKRSLYPGIGFWTCASGACGYLSFRIDGLTDDEARKSDAPPDDGFRPWLLG